MDQMQGRCKERPAYPPFRAPPHPFHTFFPQKSSTGHHRRAAWRNQRDPASPICREVLPEKEPEECRFLQSLRNRAPLCFRPPATGPPSGWRDFPAAVPVERRLRHHQIQQLAGRAASRTSMPRSRASCIMCFARDAPSTECPSAGVSSTAILDQKTRFSPEPSLSVPSGASPMAFPRSRGDCASWRSNWLEKIIAARLSRAPEWCWGRRGSRGHANVHARGFPLSCPRYLPHSHAAIANSTGGSTLGATPISP